MVLSIHAFGRGWMLHVKLLFFASCIALSFHATRKNCSTLIHSFGRGLILYLYIHTFLSRISSIILHAFLIPNFRKFHSTIHSFLEGVISLYFSIVSSVIVHCSINPCFWEGVDVACQTFHLSSYFALSFHTTRKKLLYPLPLL